MRFSYIIAIDQGTHSTRAIIYNKDGRSIFQAKQKIELERIQKYQVEQNGFDILQSCHNVLRQADQFILENQLENVAVALTTQRSTVIAWDIESGEALSPALSWLDTRAQKELSAVNLNAQEIKAKTGLPISPHYGASKLQWLLNHNNEVINANDNHKLLFGPLAAYLIFNLLESRSAYVDYSNAHRTLLWNLHTRQWDDVILEKFSIKQEQLPKPVPNTYHYGQLGKFNYPLIYVNGDQNSAMYGYAALQANATFVNVGTGGFVLAYSQQEPAIDSKLLGSIAYSSDIKQEYAIEGTINGAGASLSWVKKNWGIDEIIQIPWRDIKDVPIFINTVGGLGSPWWKSDVEPRFLNSEKTYKDYTVEQCKAALMESIIFLIASNIDEMRKFDIRPSVLIMSGGVSKDQYFCQRLADLCFIPVALSNYSETTSRGAAWLAMDKPDWTFDELKYIQPNKDTALVERYSKFVNELKRLIH